MLRQLLCFKYKGLVEVFLTLTFAQLALGRGMAGSAYRIVQAQTVCFTGHRPGQQGTLVEAAGKSAQRVKRNRDDDGGRVGDVSAKQASERLGQPELTAELELVYQLAQGKVILAEPVELLPGRRLRQTTAALAGWLQCGGAASGAIGRPGKAAKTVPAPELFMSA
ncbi:hypothetical protein BIT28_08250 [Photobacterium proteolyticum]|uniref:Uncharacterized protein n=1 Tax=Photobacterium proteolyticum TaxID=1903952 RepID=A0A1Q9GGF5_9GAMM|nr:hypothetical protein BIT28_08250 [Photobacterium proteolyticum]